jgi:RTX calcium-binding nonapeptide repeat (4 copies)
MNGFRLFDLQNAVVISGDTALGVGSSYASDVMSDRFFNNIPPGAMQQQAEKMAVNQISGEAYFLYGDAGNDVLYSDTGLDSMWGGTGSDRFVLVAGQGADTIRDFALGEDFFQLGSGISHANLSITQSGSNALIKVAGSGEQLATVFGVQSSLITASHFV